MNELEILQKELEHQKGIVSFQNEVIELLNEMTTIQEDTMKFINKVMFETTKHERSLPDVDKNLELLDLAWSTNDVICDQPRLREISEELKKLYK
jgi:hypothetical protein